MSEELTVGVMAMLGLVMHAGLTLWAVVRLNKRIRRLERPGEPSAGD